jgi:hypothetical protein
MRILENGIKIVRLSTRTGLRGKKMGHTFKPWIEQRSGKTADTELTAKAANVEERKYIDDYRYSTWDPRSLRTPRYAQKHF